MGMTGCAGAGMLITGTSTHTKTTTLSVVSIAGVTISSKLNRENLMSNQIKRRTAPECIGFRLGWNITDVSDNRYQAGRQSIPVYTIGNDYMCCPPAGVKPPKGWDWKEDGEAYGRTIYSADSRKPSED